MEVICASQVWEQNGGPLQLVSKTLRSLGRTHEHFGHVCAVSFGFEVAVQPRTHRMVAWNVPEKVVVDLFIEGLYSQCLRACLRLGAEKQPLGSQYL